MTILEPHRRVGVIYMITNKATGERYIGQTRGSANTRFENHYKTATYKGMHKTRQGRVPLYRAIRKHRKRREWEVRTLMDGVPVDMLHEAEQNAIHLWRPELNRSVFFRPEWGEPEPDLHNPNAAINL